MLQDFLKNNILLTDGAMGTYYKKICPASQSLCEFANIDQPEVISDIHRQYLESGAMLIRTNTFNANTSVLGVDFLAVKEIIEQGYNIAVDAVKKYNPNAFVGCDIGPNAGKTSEYFKIVNTFLELGAEIFVFETFSTIEPIIDVIKYIKQQKPNAFILTEFALTDTAGTTSVGIKKIVSQCVENTNIDAFGFNCGIGPKHMENVLFSTDINTQKPVSALPNAGYPEMINGKVEYVMNPTYFADLVSNYVKFGVSIIGGCCGTTPEHIKLLYKHISDIDNNLIKDDISVPVITSFDTYADDKQTKNSFHKKLDSNDFIYAVELDPPFKTDVSRLIKGAAALKKCGVDIITIADSPMGKSRVDSTVVSAKIKRETGIEVLPHMCCRDRNAIALRSSLLGAYVEDIRNVLVVTGDPVPNEKRADIKSVFNMQSYSFMSMIKDMNEDVFIDEPIRFGGAVNFNAPNKDVEYSRLLKKRSNGAEFFLTQPIFTADAIEYIKKLPKDRDFKLLGGIMPLVNYNNAMFINNEMAGIDIPIEYVERFSPDMSRDEAQKTGEKIAIEIADKIRPYIDGFYIITPFNRYEMILNILREVKK